MSFGCFCAQVVWKSRGGFWSCFIDDIIGWTFVFISLATEEDWHLCYYHFFGDIVPIRYLLMRLLSMMKTLLSSSAELKLFQALIEKVSISIWYPVVRSCGWESVILNSLLLITCLKFCSFSWYPYWLCYNACEWKIN